MTDLVEYRKRNGTTKYPIFKISVIFTIFFIEKFCNSIELHIFAMIFSTTFGKDKNHAQTKKREINRLHDEFFPKMIKFRIIRFQIYNNMKKIVFLLMTFSVFSVSAQDIIMKRNGDELQCKILEVSKNEVKYKRWSNQEGPAFTEKKSDIFMIKYENGEKDVIAYETPALESSISTPDMTYTTPNEIIVADPTPISNIYLKYKAFGSKSGIIKWGHPQTKEQAQNILTKDWLDYSSARKDERAGKIMAFTGGTLFLGGLGWTVVHSVACKRYRNAKREYDASIERYNEAACRLDNAYEKYEKALNDRQINEEKRLAYEESKNNLSDILNEMGLSWDFYMHHDSYFEASKFYDRNKRDDMNYWNYRRKRSYLIPMMGGLVTGTPLLIVGIIKAKRGHKNATQIVNKHIDEYERTQGKTSMSKPEFNIDSHGNNLVFSLTF
ncbi:MAG: hypothetical protein IKX43_06470 [Paludibacteraceae bacterium]|nr:hypothetical protein [Paludibacteraceae bacterium]